MLPVGAAARSLPLRFLLRALLDLPDFVAFVSDDMVVQSRNDWSDSEISSPIESAAGAGEGYVHDSLDSR